MVFSCSREVQNEHHKKGLMAGIAISTVKQWNRLPEVVMEFI